MEDRKNYKAYRFKFERHDFNRVAFNEPGGRGNVSILEELQDYDLKHPGRAPTMRMDILLINESWDEDCECRSRCCSGVVRKTRSRSISPKVDGTLSGPVELFTDKELAWARIEAMKCAEAGKREPLYGKLLY